MMEVIEVIEVIRVGVNSAPELDFLANSKSNSGIGIGFTQSRRNWN